MLCQMKSFCIQPRQMQALQSASHKYPIIIHTNEGIECLTKPGFKELKNRHRLNWNTRFFTAFLNKKQKILDPCLQLTVALRTPHYNGQGVYSRQKQIRDV